MTAPEQTARFTVAPDVVDWLLDVYATLEGSGAVIRIRGMEQGLGRAFDEATAISLRITSNVSSSRTLAALQCRAEVYLEMLWTSRSWH